MMRSRVALHPGPFVAQANFKTVASYDQLAAAGHERVKSLRTVLLHRLWIGARFRVEDHVSGHVAFH